MAMKKVTSPDVIRAMAEHDPTVQQMESRTPDFHSRGLMYPHMFDPRQEGSVPQEKAQKLDKYMGKLNEMGEEIKEYHSSPQWLQNEAMFLMAPEMRMMIGAAPQQALRMTPRAKAKGIMGKVREARKIMQTDAPELVDDLMKGTWFQGKKRGRYFTKGSSYEGSTSSPLNFGEPSGVSLTMDPSVAESFAGRRPKLPMRMQAKLDKMKGTPKEMDKMLDNWSVHLSEKYGEKWSSLMKPKEKELYDFIRYETDEAWAQYHKGAQRTTRRMGMHPEEKTFARVQPQLSAPAKEKMLIPWKEEHKAIISQAYDDAAREVLGPDDVENLREILKGVELPKKGSLMHGTEYNPHRTKVKAYLANNYHDQMQKLITANMQKAGFEGILYSPHRYGEFEMKIFDPKQVMQKDLWSQKALARKGGKGLRWGRGKGDKWFYNLPMTSGAGLEGGAVKGYSRGDVPKEVYQWMKEGTEASKSSLGHLYKDVPLEDMVPGWRTGRTPVKPKADATGYLKALMKSGDPKLAIQAAEDMIEVGILKPDLVKAMAKKHMGDASWLADDALVQTQKTRTIPGRMARAEEHVPGLLAEFEQAAAKGEAEVEKMISRITESQFNEITKELKEWRGTMSQVYKDPNYFAKSKFGDWVDSAKKSGFKFKFAPEKKDLTKFMGGSGGGGVGSKWTNKMKEQKARFDALEGFMTDQSKGAKLPAVKGALGRETLEKKILSRLPQAGRTAEEIKFIRETMMNADVPQLQRLLDKLLSGGK